MTNEVEEVDDEEQKEQGAAAVHIGEEEQEVIAVGMRKVIATGKDQVIVVVQDDEENKENNMHVDKKERRGYDDDGYTVMSPSRSRSANSCARNGGQSRQQSVLLDDDLPLLQSDDDEDKVLFAPAPKQQHQLPQQPAHRPRPRPRPGPGPGPGHLQEHQVTQSIAPLGRKFLEQHHRQDQQPQHQRKHHRHAQRYILQTSTLSSRGQTQQVGRDPPRAAAAAATAQDHVIQTRPSHLRRLTKHRRGASQFLVHDDFEASSEPSLPPSSQAPSPLKRKKEDVQSAESRPSRKKRVPSTKPHYSFSSQSPVDPSLLWDQPKLSAQPVDIRIGNDDITLEPKPDSVDDYLDLDYLSSVDGSDSEHDDNDSTVPPAVATVAAAAGTGHPSVPCSLSTVATCHACVPLSLSAAVRPPSVPRASPAVDTISASNPIDLTGEAALDTPSSAVIASHHDKALAAACLQPTVCLSDLAISVILDHFKTQETAVKYVGTPVKWSDLKANTRLTLTPSNTAVIVPLYRPALRHWTVLHFDLIGQWVAFYDPYAFEPTPSPEILQIVHAVAIALGIEWFTPASVHPIKVSRVSTGASSDGTNASRCRALGRPTSTIVVFSSSSTRSTLLPELQDRFRTSLTLKHGA